MWCHLTSIEFIYFDDNFHRIAQWVLAFRSVVEQLFATQRFLAQLEAVPYQYKEFCQDLFNPLSLGIIHHFQKDVVRVISISYASR